MVGPQNRRPLPRGQATYHSLSRRKKYPDISIDAYFILKIQVIVQRGRCKQRQRRKITDLHAKGGSLQGCPLRQNRGRQMSVPIVK